jgi:hypothetical protein
MFTKPEIEYVYTFWGGKLERCTVESYNAATEQVSGRQKDGRRFVSNLSCGMYFRTPEEAIREDQTAAKESLKEYREEVADILAAYKVAKRIALTPFPEYYASIPKDF